ncbi:NUDIX hydrolase [Haliangium sp.]|uniref:NUDIX hydrolase n=1 Tax=Haliangium sp. TaxID=2663208 RepID=UPI003D0A010C
MIEITGFDVDSDDIIGQEGGFLGVRRLRLRNRRSDGSLSARYTCDFLVRPHGHDAVVVALYHRTKDGVEVLLRDALRPALAFGRDPAGLPVPDERPYMFFTELVAGIIENHDKGLDGVRKRAAEEALEEAGYRIDPDAVEMLGGSFPSPGAMAEKFWFTAVEITDPGAQSTPEGDGSPMEEGAAMRWMTLDQAIKACARGEIEDAKTEIGLRRLAEHLA